MTSINKDFSAIVRGETGFDWNFNNDLNLSNTSNRFGKDRICHQKLLKFKASRIF